MQLPFEDRQEGGRALAEVLADRADLANAVILGLPRGGIPVAAEVAHLVRAPLDVFLVRKLGVPGHEELAMGAIASGGVRVLNEAIVRELAIPAPEIDRVAAEELEELDRREQLYRDGRKPVPIDGRHAVVVDDGLATGATMRVAVIALRRLGPSRITVAVPVGAPESCSELSEVADEVVCAAAPQPFYAVGLWYRRFSQTTDEEVIRLLAGSAEASRAASAGAKR
jgi:putative phosphoribosyl transferase